MEEMTKKAMILTGIGILIAICAGYAYYHYVGCTSDSLCYLSEAPLYGV
jgi:hypothetical protein